jgi:hypothetical protein
MPPTISKDTPCYSMTTVAHNRLPVFRTDAIKSVLAPPLTKRGVPVALRYSLTSSCPTIFTS